MADFYYGGGLCSIVGDFRAVQIEYRGAIEITDKTEDSFVFLTNRNRIIIYPGDYFHDATNYYGKSFEDARLFQTFFMNRKK